MTLADFVRLRQADPGGLSYAQYVAVARTVDALTPAETGFPELRLAVLRNATIETLLPVLVGEIAAAGFHPTIYLGAFDAIEMDVMDPASALFRFKPDFVIVFNWLEALSPAFARRFAGMDPEGARTEARRVTAGIEDIVSAIVRNTEAVIFINNFPLTLEPTLGILDGQSSDGQTPMLLAMNERLRAIARDNRRTNLVDFMRIFARLGASEAYDERYWEMARAPISTSALIPIGREYGKFVRALRGKTKKCLVVDCDNTLWGGVVGEDGLAGIKVGETYPGSAFLALQREILNLHDRGVLLAVCSKNNLDDVLQVFREHPSMLLKEHHFAAMQINWDDKVSNLRRIADDLNIGTDSLVFVDDSAFETALVRAQMPEVSVIHLPERAYSTYRSLLLDGGLFDSLTYTAEDRRRNAMYAEDRQRESSRANAASLEEYLFTLGICVEIGRPSEIDVPRVSQLTQKTNQFNLTTRRYDVGEIEGLMMNPNADVLGLKVRDSISDLGLVGVAVVLYVGDSAEIQAFLMSCRSLGRGVEDAMLASVVRRASERGSAYVVGTFRPTAKNGMVETFYERHGFRRSSMAGEETRWELALEGDAQIKDPVWITTITTENAHVS